MSGLSPKTEEERKQHREDAEELRLNHACFMTTTFLQRLVETYPLKAVLQKHVVTISWDEDKKWAVVIFSPQ